MNATTDVADESLTRDAPSAEYKRVYLWQWPIRAMHWIAAACIIVLVVTGFYIGRPYFFTSGAASDHFLMGRVRFAPSRPPRYWSRQGSCASTGSSPATSSSAGVRSSQ